MKFLIPLTPSSSSCRRRAAGRFGLFSSRHADDALDRRLPLRRDVVLLEVVVEQPVHLARGQRRPSACPRAPCSAPRRAPQPGSGGRGGSAPPRPPTPPPPALRRPPPSTSRPSRGKIHGRHPFNRSYRLDREDSFTAAPLQSCRAVIPSPRGVPPESGKRQGEQGAAPVPAASFVARSARVNPAPTGSRSSGTRPSSPPGTPDQVLVLRRRPRAEHDLHLVGRRSRRLVLLAASPSAPAPASCRLRRR